MSGFRGKAHGLFKSHDGAVCAFQGIVIAPLFYEAVACQNLLTRDRHVGLCRAVEIMDDRHFFLVNFVTIICHFGKIVNSIERFYSFIRIILIIMGNNRLVPLIKAHFLPDLKNI